MFGWSNAKNLQETGENPIIGDGNVDNKNGESTGIESLTIINGNDGPTKEELANMLEEYSKNEITKLGFIIMTLVAVIFAIVIILLKIRYRKRPSANTESRQTFIINSPQISNNAR